jgi:hypothetical protein
MKKKIFFSMNEGFIQEEEDKKLFNNVIWMWERGRPIDDMLEMSKFSYNRVKEIIRNHIGETQFDAIARSVKNKILIADIATSVGLPESTIVRIIDFFDFK